MHGGKFEKIKIEDQCYYHGILKTMSNLPISALVLRGRPRKGLVHLLCREFLMTVLLPCLVVARYG